MPSSSESSSTNKNSSTTDIHDNQSHDLVQTGQTGQTDDNNQNNVPAHQCGPLVTSLDDNNQNFFTWLKSTLGRKSNDSLRQAIEEYIEVNNLDDSQDGSSLATHEKTLIANVLKLRDLETADVMVPRADIISFDLSSPAQDFLAMLAKTPHTRIPVYKDSMDDIMGTIHIKDVLHVLAIGEKLDLEKIIRNVPIVSPALPILDLLLQMRQSRKHMALVVDEFGGIDGLVTIGDLIEVIVGEFYDEYDRDQSPKMFKQKDNTYIADARVTINDFENEIGPLIDLDNDEEDIDTLGGLIFSISGRVPARGEIITHDYSGTVFEILDADPRRVKKMRIKYQQADQKS